MELGNCHELNALWQFSTNLSDIFFYRHLSSVFLLLLRIGLLLHALSLLKVLLCFSVLRMGADIAEQEHSLLIFRTDAVGLHGLQTLQGSELLSHGRLSLLGMTTEEDEHKGC